MTGVVWSPAPSERQRNTLNSGIAFLREHGFFVGVRNVREELSARSIDWLYESADAEGPIVPLIEIDPDQDYYLGFVNAPVYDGRREAAFVLALQGFNNKFTGAEIMQIGQRLREACDRVASFIAHPIKAKA